MISPAEIEIPTADMPGDSPLNRNWDWFHKANAMFVLLSEANFFVPTVPVDYASRRRREHNTHPRFPWKVVRVSLSGQPTSIVAFQ